MAEAFKKNLNVTSGAVAASATSITSGPTNHARRLNLVFANTGTGTEVLILTLARQGGTQRRLKRVILDPNEQLEIGGLPLDADDVLYGTTTTADVVDYLVSIAADNAPLSMVVYDQYGAMKTAPQILEQVSAITG